MNLKIDKKELEKALNIITKVISKKITLPVLEYVLFDFINESGTKYIVLRSTDLENTITYFLYTDFPEKIKNFMLMEPINLKSFLNKIKNIEEIELELSDNNLIFKAGKDLLTLNINYKTNEFPSYPDIKEKNEFSLNYKEFKSLIDTAFDFVSYDQLRPIMGSICINKLDDDSFDFVSSDTVRLFKYNTQNIKIEEDIKELKISLPKSIKSILPTSDVEIIYIKNGETFVELTIDNIIIYSQKNEGNYPNYDSVIPKENPYSVYLNKENLIDVLNKATLISNETGLAVLDINKKRINIEIKNNINNISYKSELEVNSKIKEPIKIGVKSEFLLSILKNINKEEIIIEYNNNKTPLIIKIKENDNLLFLLMPMMI